MKRVQWAFTVSALILCLSSGCGEAATTETPTAKKGEKPIVFSPRPPEQNTGAGANDPVSAAYERAANRFASFAASTPGEQSQILREGLPLLEEALKGSDERRARDARAVDLRAICKLDGRFSEARVWKSFQAVANRNISVPVARELNAIIVYPDAGGLPKSSEPSTSGASPVEVARVMPGTIAKVAEFGAGFAKKTYDDLAFANGVASLLEAAMKQANPGDLLKLKATDSLEEREQKIVVQSALEAFLGNIVSHNGSFFLAGERKSGIMEIWEFKHRITMSVTRATTDTKTRLNTGVELTMKVEFSHDGSADLCRRYLSGYWGTWGEFPKMGEIEITKDENWNATFKSDLPFRSFHRLSSAEIDLALTKTGTTKVIAAAEQKIAGDQATSAVKLTLLNFYAAREDYEKAHEIASGFLSEDEVELPVAKRLATALLGEVAFARPAIGETIQSGVGFKYSNFYKGLNPEIGEMQKLSYPRRLQKGYFYGEAFDLSDCLKAFELLNSANPSDPDTLFDLSLLEIFGSERFRKPRETGNDTIERQSAKHLAEAVAAAKAAPPKSGRDFEKLITGEPTFIVLNRNDDFEKLLASILGGAQRIESGYYQKFQRQTDYLNAGY